MGDEREERPWVQKCPPLPIKFTPMDPSLPWGRNSEPAFVIIMNGFKNWKKAVENSEHMKHVIHIS